MFGLFIELKFSITAIYFLNYHKKCKMFVHKFASVYYSRQHGRLLEGFAYMPYVRESQRTGPYLYRLATLFWWPFCFVFAGRGDPDEMPHNATFHLNLHCLPNQ